MNSSNEKEAGAPQESISSSVMGIFPKNDESSDNPLSPQNLSGGVSGQPQSLEASFTANSNVLAVNVNNEGQLNLNSTTEFDTFDHLYNSRTPLDLDRNKQRSPSIVERIRNSLSPTSRPNSFDLQTNNINLTNSCKVAPSFRTNPLSRLFVSWQTPFVRLGARRPLQMEDIYKLPKDFGANLGSRALQKYFSNPSNNQPDDGKGGKRLLSAIWKRHGREWSISGIFQLLHITANLTSMRLMRPFLDAASTATEFKRTDDIWYAFGLICIIAVLQIVSTLCSNLFFIRTMTLGMRIRTELTASLYSKCLRLNSSARAGSFGPGQVSQLISADTFRIDGSTPYIHMLWSSPLQVIVILILIWGLIGPSVLVGFAIMILFIPIQGFVMRKIAQGRKKLQAVTDERVKLLSEIIQGSKIVKLFSWESSFLAEMDEVRARELKQVLNLSVFRGATNNFSMALPTLAMVIVFLVYAGGDNDLQPQIVFTTMILFNMLRLPLMFIPMMGSMAAEAYVSLGRLSRLFEAPESTDQPAQVAKNATNLAIDVDNASFEWKVPLKTQEKQKKEQAQKEKQKKEKKQKTPDNLVSEVENPGKLIDISFKVPHGALVAIVGPVGSGKSSLLSALVGEIEKLAGKVTIAGSLAYCPQQAWVQNATVRDNIVFGSMQFDEAKYKRALKLACFERDLDVLPSGDMTEIGEKGINLSGGQRARINLARAIYCDSDILLLDDPMSAVDAHVGAFLFQKTISRELAGKTRILVTHALHVLQDCDYIFSMAGGKIQEQGRYSELMQSNGPFATMMRNFGAKSRENSPVSSRQASPEPQEKRKSIVETEKKKQSDKIGRKLISDEERATGSVEWRFYKHYFNAMGGTLLMISALLVILIPQVTQGLGNIWFTLWSENKLNLSVSASMWGYFGFGLINTISITIVGIYFAVLGTRAARSLHSQAASGILRAPMAFFDTTPLGRILSRFSKDIDSIDNSLVDAFRMFLNTATSALISLVLVIYSLPPFIFPLAPMVYIYYLFQKLYRRVSRELKRIDSVSRSPVFAHFAESLTGLPTIKAYCVELAFHAKLCELVDKNNRPGYMQLCLQRWLSIRLEIIGIFLLLTAGGLPMILLAFGVNMTQGSLLGAATAGFIGLSVSSVQSITGVLNWSVRQATETEVQMNSVERLSFYANELEDETIQDKSKQNVALPLGFPVKGEVDFENVVLTYRPGLPPALKGVSFKIPAGMRVGVVGRTGSGKSSLIVSLFRLTNIESGTIRIDGIDTSQVPVRELRKCLTIIPQEPILFTGTIRRNLDRFNQNSDEKLWNCLQEAGMKEFVEALPGKLDYKIAENGENLSVGQRQLLCLARAMTTTARILVLDEVTASVDPATDAQIQQSVRRIQSVALERRNSGPSQHLSPIANGLRTIITIAHRLNTIIDNDLILGMADGLAVEFDSPKNLLNNPNSLFSRLVAETGPENEAMLRSFVQ